jgi:RNA polymerase sigma factor (sigma-70 family)
MGGMTPVRSDRELTDDQLLARVRAGDRGAFGELWRRHEPDARAFARHLTHSNHEADDVVAEAFAKVLRAIHGGAGPTEAFRPYLRTAVRRTWWRRSTVRPLAALDEDDRVAAPVPDDVGFDGAACRAFRRLNPRWQTVLWLADIQGRSSAEVGTALGLSPNAAAALIGRAREGLRRAYDDESAAVPTPAAPTSPVETTPAAAA